MTNFEAEVRIDLGRARDQGPRSTCLSFALSEVHRAAISLGDLLSPESLHRMAAVRAGKEHTEGLTVTEAIDGLAADGQLTEANWPYGCVVALDASAKFYRATARPHVFSEALCAKALCLGIPLALIIDIDASFFSHRGEATLGLIDGSQIQGRHAVVLCGSRPIGANTVYLIKNSWGASWGHDGYAWLNAKYVLTRSQLLVWI